LAKLEKEFEQAKEEITERHDREVEWEKLTRCVSDFESMANQLCSILVRLPTTPNRKSNLQSLSFQRILKAAMKLDEWYGFNFLENVSKKDHKFLYRMFNRRHLFIHNAGRVDQEYLDNTGDTSVRLNQVLRVRSKEINRLIKLVMEAGQRLIQGYEAIQ